MSSLSLGILLCGLAQPHEIVAVIRAYLDDSGSDDRPIVVMAGYLATLSSWRGFELRARKMMARHGVNEPFHAKKFHDRDGVYKGWGAAKQLAFVTELYDIAKEAGVLVGVSHATQKNIYRQRGIETGLNKNRSPYGWAFQMMFDRIMKDVGPLIREQGIQFFIEDGNNNNPDVEAVYERWKKEESFGLKDILRGISFVPKDSSHAIQFADFIAFYSRRHDENCVAAGGPLPVLPPFLQIALSRLRHISFVANDFFGADPSGVDEQQT